ncbi:MAG: hypothetical protein K2X47_07650, partial [Bdellovibrionales bacterium]|nr:hypothetical protein [Bdellovibrionales bacterium]
RNVTREFVIDEILNEILTRAQQGDAKPFSNQVSSLQFFDSSEKILQIHRTWTLPYVQKLFSALALFTEGQEVIALTAPLIFNTSVITEIQNAQDFNESMALIEKYFEIAGAFSFIDLDPLLQKAQALLENGTIQIQDYRRVFQIFQIEQNGFLAYFYESFVQAFEIGEKTSAGSLQAELLWYRSHLGSAIDPSTPRYTALKKRFDALIKPAAEAGRVRSAAICSRLAH